MNKKKINTRSKIKGNIAKNLKRHNGETRKEIEKGTTLDSVFSSLANTIPQLAWYTDDKGAIQWYNQRWYDFTGTTFEEVRDWGWYKVHHPDHVERVVERFKRAIKEGVAWEDTFPLRRSDGQFRWFLSRAMPIREQGGTHLYWFGTNTDITEQLNYEHVMRESEDRLKMAKEAACIGIQDIDLTKNVVHIDNIIMNIWGLPETDSIISIDEFESVICPDDIDDYRKCIEAAIEGDGHYTCEYDLINLRTNALVTVESRGKIIFEDNKPVKIIGTIQEITDRRKAEETQKLLSAIVSSTDDAVISKSLDNLVTSWNQGAERLFGYSAKEMVNQSISKIIPQEKHEESMSILEKLRAGESINNFETVRIDRSGNQLNVSVTWSPLKKASGEVIGAAKVVRDITYYKAMQKGLEEKSQTLEERNKQLTEIKSRLEEADTQKNQFLAILGHELRNPLSSIAGAIDVLRLTPDKAESLMTVMEKGIKRITTLLDDMLDLSRISLGQLRLNRNVFDLRETIQEARNAVSILYKSKSQSLKIDLPSDPIWVYADPIRIEQVCINLLTNASKYTPQEGNIRISTKIEGNQVCVVVKDDGTGIEEDMLEKVFEPFFGSGATTDTPKSMGIGLSLVKHLIELHDGVVRAYSRGRNMGAEITFTLPHLPNHNIISSEIEEVDAVASDHSLSGLRIALVDDNPDAMKGIQILLQHHDCEVMTASNGSEALDNANKFKPSVFIIDIGMPDMTGYELATRLRNGEFANSLIIALTGYSHKTAHQLSSDAGIDHHINKPLKFDQLLALLRSWRFKQEK